MECPTFTLGGVSYPARVSMGALREFRKETGKDFLKIQSEVSGEDLGVLLWASIKRQSRVEGIEFSYTCDEFFDLVTPDDVSQWYIGTGQAEQNDTDAGDSKKKTLPG